MQVVDFVLLHLGMPTIGRGRQRFSTHTWPLASDAYSEVNAENSSAKTLSGVSFDLMSCKALLFNSLISYCGNVNENGVLLRFPRV